MDDIILFNEFLLVKLRNRVFSRKVNFINIKKLLKQVHFPQTRNVQSSLRRTPHSSLAERIGSAGLCVWNTADCFLSFQQRCRFESWHQTEHLNAHFPLILPMVHVGDKTDLAPDGAFKHVLSRPTSQVPHSGSATLPCLG
jgi:hypothetical protein